MKYQIFINSEVKAAFDVYPKNIKDKLLMLRQLIFQSADESAEIGMKYP